jgi:hypothetical protein
MLARRLLLLIAVLLVAGAFASAIAPRDTTKNDRTGTSSGTTASTPAPAPAPATSAGLTVEAELPGTPGGKTKTVHARVGDLIDLTVRASGPDTVTIEGYDEVQPADADNPARFSFFADQQGAFDVTLQQEGTLAGRLQIDPAA